MGERIAVITGDADPRITEAAVLVLQIIGQGELEFEELGLNGSLAGIDGGPLPEAVGDAVGNADAVLLGEVGGTWWQPGDPGPAPETAERGLQKAIGAHAYVQPVRTFEALADRSPFKDERVGSVDLVVVHAIGGPYYGEKGRGDDGSVRDESAYSPDQVKTVGRTAFQIALARAEKTGRPPRVLSADKSNVLEVSRLWRSVMSELHEEEYPEAELRHILADNAAMELASRPDELDVIVTDNMFGDILAGEAAGLSVPELVPSGWVSPEGRGIFTSARPEGQDNALAAFLSCALMLRHALGRTEDAAELERAVADTLGSGHLPPDLGGDSTIKNLSDEVIGRLLPISP